MKKLVILLAVLVAATPVMAQWGNLQAISIKHWKVSKDFTLAVAGMMPDDSYDFKPNPEEMGFGQLMFHIASSNAGSCGMVIGKKLPIQKPEKFDKATVTKILTESFDFCISAQESMTDQQADALTGPEGRQSTGVERLWSAFTHTAHHRGQAEVYLRVKGLKPPQYRF